MIHTTIKAPYPLRWERLEGIVLFCVIVWLVWCPSKLLSQSPPDAIIPKTDVTAVRWHHHSQQIAVGYSNGLVSIWDVSINPDVEVAANASYINPHASVTTLDFAPDRSLLAIGYNDGTVVIWDTENNLQNSLQKQGDCVYLLRWSPDGTRLAGKIREHVLVWETTSGEILVTLPDDTVYMAWSTNEYLVSQTLAGKTNVWNPETGQLISSLHAGTQSMLSPDGLFIGSAEANQISIWNIQDGELITRSNNGHRAGITTTAWSPDGRRFASGSGILGEDYSVRIWDTMTGDEELVMEGHQDIVVSLLWCPDNSYLVSASLDDTVRVWDTTTGQSVGTFNIDIDDKSKVYISPDGELVATINNDGSVSIWDISVQRQ